MLKPISGRVKSVTEISKISTSTGESSTESPRRALLYMRSPPTFFAEYCGGTCWPCPLNVANSASICFRVGIGAPSWTRTVVPAASWVSVSIPRRARATYVLGSDDKYSASRVAGPTSKISSPEAKGSSVPV